VIRRLHSILEAQGLPAVDTVKGVFTEGKPIYPGSGFDEKTHIQIAVRNQRCIKGIFRISGEHVELLKTRRHETVGRGWAEGRQEIREEVAAGLDRFRQFRLQRLELTALLLAGLMRWLMLLTIRASLIWLVALSVRQRSRDSVEDKGERTP
jgi:hypothetical protein